MDGMTRSLNEILAREVADYARAQGYKDTAEYIEDAARQVYEVVVVPHPDHPLLKKPRLMILAKIIDRRVVIEEDTTDKPLYLELMRCGIPREQIILKYAGEKMPDSGLPEGK
jgi:hypothetical protein